MHDKYACAQCCIIISRCICVHQCAQDISIMSAVLIYALLGLRWSTLCVTGNLCNYDIIIRGQYSKQVQYCCYKSIIIMTVGIIVFHSEIFSEMFLLIQGVMFKLNGDFITGPVDITDINVDGDGMNNPLICQSERTSLPTSSIGDWYLNHENQSIHMAWR